MKAFESVAGWANTDTAAKEPPGAKPQYGKFDIEAFIAKHLPVRRGPLAWDGSGRKWEIETCPFNSEHAGGCAVVTQAADGKLGFKCQHDSCIDQHWKDVRQLFEGPLPNGAANGATDGGKGPSRPVAAPVVMGMAEIMAVEIPESQMLVEDLVPRKGAALVVAAAKTGKTIVSVQIAVAVATGKPLLGYYRVIDPGPALLVEQDDPSGAESVKGILIKSCVPLDMNMPLTVTPRVPFSFGPELLAWLENQIRTRGLHLVILDSYTSLRPERRTGGDLVKVEHTELTLLDDLGKRTNCALLVVHHESKGSAAMDWSDRAAGSFAMTAATEAQIHISRFSDLDIAAPERLIRVRGRHQEDKEIVLRFRKDTLDFEHVMEGAAAGLYPLIQQMKTHFGSGSFGPKELVQTTGASRATASRQIDRLHRANALRRLGHGEYVLTQ